MNDEEEQFDRNAALLTLVPDLANREDLDGIPPRVFQKPVRRLSPGELLGLIERGIAPEICVPLALDKLEGDAFLQAAGHPGDLMTGLLELPTTFWQERYELWATTAELLGEALGGVQARAAAENQGEFDDPPEEGPWLPQFFGDDFMGAVLHFREIFRES